VTPPTFHAAGFYKAQEKMTGALHRGNEKLSGGS
jgi:hypothetical protein